MLGNCVFAPKRKYFLTFWLDCPNLNKFGTDMASNKILNFEKFKWPGIKDQGNKWPWNVNLFPDGSNDIKQFIAKKKLKCDISRSCVTLAFDPRSFKLFWIKDFIICYVCAKFDEVLTVQSKVKKYFRFGAKTLFLKLQYLKNPCIKLYWNKLRHWSRVNDNF